MSQTPPPTLDPLPPAPSTNTPSTFSALMDAFLAALIVFRTQLVALASNMYNNAVDAYNSASSAIAQAQAAIAAVGAQAFVSGQAYAKGATVYSNTNLRTYRRLSAGSSATDPALDTANWVCITPSPVPNETRLVASGSWTSDATDFKIRLQGSGATGGGPGGQSGGYLEKTFRGVPIGTVCVYSQGTINTGSSTFTVPGVGTVTVGSGRTDGAGGGATGGDLNIPGVVGSASAVSEVYYTPENGVVTASNGGAGAPSIYGRGGPGSGGDGEQQYIDQNGPATSVPAQPGRAGMLTIIR